MFECYYYNVMREFLNVRFSTVQKNVFFLKSGGLWRSVFFTDVASRSHLSASDVAARSLYAYLKNSSSWVHKKLNIMHMHDEKLNKAINDSMSLLLTTPADEQDRTPIRMAMIHPYTYTYIDTYLYIYIGMYCGRTVGWLQVSCVYGTYLSLHIRQQETTRT